MKLLCVFLAASAGWAQVQPNLRNQITFSGGWARQFALCSLCPPDTALSLGVTYGFRVFPHVQVEAGVVAALNPNGEFRGAYYDITPEDRYIWVPFGLRGILPVDRGRVEFSLGAGGLYENYSFGNANAAPFGFYPHTGWGGYATASAAVAIDRRRHFWLGVSPRWSLAKLPFDSRNRWFVLTADVGVRF